MLNFEYKSHANYEWLSIYLLNFLVQIRTCK